MATKTKTPASIEDVARVLDLMVSVNEQIAARLTCPHADAMTNREKSLLCPKCVSVRALRDNHEGFGTTTAQQERFRALHNALVNAIVAFGSTPAGNSIREVTAQARPIMHSWGW